MITKLFSKIALSSVIVSFLYAKFIPQKFLKKSHRHRKTISLVTQTYENDESEVQR